MTIGTTFNGLGMSLGNLPLLPLARRLAGRGRRHLREGGVPIQDLVKDRVREDLEGKACSDSPPGFFGIFRLLSCW